MHWIWFIIVGAMVGFSRSVAHPGRDPMGFILRTAIGVSLDGRRRCDLGRMAGLRGGIVIAALLVAVIGHFTADRPATRRSI